MSVIDNITDEQRAEFNQALEFIASCDYKGTAVKIELEAQLNRPYDGGSSTCSTCDGDGYYYCGECYDGSFECHTCDNDRALRDACPDCDEGYTPCEDCGGYARVDCQECASGSVDNDEDWSEEGCEAYIRDHVPDEALEAMVYGNFYNDGSVDSEFTFTLPIAKAEYALYFIEAFNSLGNAIGNGISTGGAGMHIAILNDEDCNYEPHDDNNYIDRTKFQNFRRSMTPLLPALYFLASEGRESRELRYRVPGISDDEKYYAISASRGVLEYRVFETCYKRPLALIDYLIVIANTLKYYKDTPTDTSMKIGTLGFKHGEGLERFYFSEKHIDALERGVAILKPVYKSYEQLKAERHFTIDKTSLKAKQIEREAKWRKDFAQVKSRRRFERLRIYHEGLAKAYSYVSNGELKTTEVTGYAKEYLHMASSNRSLKGNIKKYIEDQTNNFLTDDIQHTITV